MTKPSDSDARHERDPSGPLEPTLPDRPAANRQRRRIGPYRILEVLGEGGMGTVYLAEEEEPIRRLVALKVIRASHADRHLAHRFEAERQALAMMNHPNIAQVYHAGDTEEGEPYLVMEVVRGLPITEFCDLHRLSVRQRLGLLIDACYGLQHAHQKGVLHRDIKPSNLLVMREEGKPPVTKIIDFGIAKALDRPLVDGTLTRAEVLGTPAYLSPELMLGEGEVEVDTRSDVYALGVVLYELLVGSRPFARKGDSLFRIMERLQHEEAVAPSRRFASLDAEAASAVASSRRTTVAALSRALRGDLDWITLKAMAKERAERYASAAGLAADLRRHLDNLPVLAGPPSRIYRGRKFIQRHRAGVVASLLVVTALVVGLVARTVEAGRANREAAAARLAQRQTEEVVEFLLRLFEVSDPDRSRGETVTARELLDRGAARLEEELENQPRARARMLDTIGVVYGQLALYDEAESALQQALRLRQSVDAGRPEGVAQSLNHLGDLYWVKGDYGAAEEFFRQALDIYERRTGPGSLEVAEVLDNLGSVYNILGRYAEAEELFTRALEIREERLGSSHPAVASSLDDLAVLLLDQHRFVEAETRFRRALAIREAALGAEHTEVAQTLNGLASAISGQGRDGEAVALHRRALEIRQRRLPAEHPDVAQSLYNLANAYQYLGEVEEAEGLYRKALQIWEGSLGSAHPRVGIGLHALAEVEAELGRQEEAEALYRRSLSTFEQALGPHHPNLAFPLHGLGGLLAENGRVEEAEELFRRALAIRREALPADSAPLLASMEALTDLYRETGRAEEAAAVEADVLGSAEP